MTLSGFPISAGSSFQWVSGESLPNLDLGNITAPVVRIGSAGFIVLSGPADLTSRVNTLSLLANGTISSSQSLAVPNFNADGTEVSFTGANSVDNLSGRARDGNFNFNNVGALNLGSVDPANTPPGVSATGIAKLSAGGNITGSAGGYAVQGGAVILDSSGAIGSEDNPLWWAPPYSTSARRRVSTSR